MGVCKKTKEYRLSQGFCSRCGEFPFREGKKTCKKCYHFLQEYEKKDRQRRKEKGICQKCPNKAVSNRIYCEKHLICRRQTARSKSNERIAEGLCTSCGELRNNRKRMCDICFKKYSKSQREEYLKRQSEGVCVYCGKNQSLQTINSCKICFFKNLATNHFGTRQRHQELNDLFDSQQGLCAITGIILDLGNTASLDHIIPSSKGGLHDIKNLRFVHIWINLMKMDSLDEIFIPKFKSWIETANQSLFKMSGEHHDT